MEPKATLHIDNNENYSDREVQGLILPSFTTQERAHFSREKLKKGLMIYNRTKNCIDYWNSAEWSCLNGTEKDTSFIDTDIVRANSKKGYVGINTGQPKASLDIIATDTDVDGLLLPSFSSEKRNLFQLREEHTGVMIYNTTKNCVEFWNSQRWSCINE